MKSQFLAAAFAAVVLASPAKDVVITIYPAYDWTRTVVGTHTNEFNLTLLQKSGADLHSFKPTAKDVAKVAGCDLFIHVGGESDEWVGPLLRQSPKPTRQVLNFLAALGSAVRNEEMIEGMQAEEGGGRSQRRRRRRGGEGRTCLAFPPARRTARERDCNASCRA